MQSIRRVKTVEVLRNSKPLQIRIPLAGIRMRKVYPPVGKDPLGLVCSVRLNRTGSTMRNWAGIIHPLCPTGVYGCGTKRMGGNGLSRESSPTSSDGVIQAGFTFRGNSTDGPSFTITPPSYLNKLIVELFEYRLDRIATFNRPLCCNQLLK